MYAAGLRRLWQRAGRGRGIRTWEAAAFACGLLVLAVSLSRPVSDLADALFSVHMGQHEALMLLAAPLLVLGRPGLVWLWAFDARGRDVIGHWTQQAAVSRLWRLLSAPITVFLLHGIVLWLWHVPTFFNAALASEPVHVFQHSSFLITAALFWWGMVHGRYGPIGYGVAVLYVFLTALHSSVLGALMTVATSVWYVPYGTSAHPWAIDPLQDQQLAGLIMWIPTTLIFIAFGLSLLAAWLGQSERHVRFNSERRLHSTGGTEFPRRSSL
jgi:putative membrane protein